MADNWTVTAIVGIVSAVAGWCMGYYKSRALDAELRAKGAEKRQGEMSLYVKKTDCEKCAEARAEIQDRVDVRIEAGSRMFAELQTGQALLIQRVEALTKQIEKLAV